MKKILGVNVVSKMYALNLTPVSLPYCKANL